MVPHSPSHVNAAVPGQFGDVDYAPVISDELLAAGLRVVDAAGAAARIEIGRAWTPGRRLALTQVRGDRGVHTLWPFPPADDRQDGSGGVEAVLHGGGRHVVSVFAAESACLTLLWFGGHICAMRSIVYALLLAGLAASAALTLPFAHAQQAPDQRPFITTWKTDAANQAITIPLVGSGMTIH